MQEHGCAGDKVLFKAAVKAPTEALVHQHIERMTPGARTYVRKTPLHQQFPACLKSACGLMGATTSNWAEQEMSTLKSCSIRSSPDLLSALMAVVEYAGQTYKKNYSLAHAEIDEVVSKFQVSYEQAYLRALNQNMAISESIDNKVARVKSATKAHVEYVSTLHEDGSSVCSCGAFKVTGKFCWHFAQHCRTFGLNPWNCKFQIYVNGGYV